MDPAALLFSARTSWKNTWKSRVYDLLPSILFNLLLLPFVFVTRVEEWLGNRAFFCFVLVHLAFYPGGNTVGSHVELVVLGAIGSTIWLGLGYLVVCGQVWIDAPQPIYSSAASRGVGACYLFVTFFIGGALWSRVPRLRSAMRVGMFVQTWALTGSAGEITASNFTQLFYPVIVTAVLSLVSNLCFPRTGRDAYFQAACSGLETVSELSQVAVKNFDSELRLWLTRDRTAQNAPESMGAPPPLQQSLAFIQLREKLRATTSKMRQALAATNHELAYCRVPVSRMGETLAFLVDFETWMFCGFGMDLPAAPFEEDAFVHPTDEALSADEEQEEGDTTLTREDTTEPAEPVHTGVKNATVPKVQISHCEEKGAGEGDRPEAEPSAGATGAGAGAPPSTNTHPLGTSAPARASAPPEADITSHSGEIHLGNYTHLASLHTHLQDSLAALHVVTEACYGRRPSASRPGTLDLAQSLFHATPHKHPRDLLRRQRDALQVAIDRSRIELHRLVESRTHTACVRTKAQRRFSPAGTTPHAYSGASTPSYHAMDMLSEPTLFCTDLCALSFYALTLIEVSYRTIRLMETTDKTIAYFESHPHRTFHFPKLNFRRWFMSSSGLGLFQNTADTPLGGHQGHAGNEEETETTAPPPPPETTASTEAHPDELSELFDDIRDPGGYRTYATNIAKASENTHTYRVRVERSWFMTRVHRIKQRITRHAAVIDVRIRLSQAVRRIKRSRHAQFALKLAAGVVLLSIPAFLEPGANQWWNREHGQWMVISYIWCLEASTGDSIRISLCRIIGTIAGAVTGLLAYEISRENVFALAFLVVLFEIPASILRLHTRYPPIGTVMGLTTPIVALVPYLGNTEYSSGMVAVVRGYMICLGIVAALLMNTLIFPYHARTKLNKKLAGVATNLQTMYMNLTRHMFYVGFYASDASHKRFARVERHMRTHIAECRGLIEVMNTEVSLVPKPIAVLNQVLVRLESIFHLLIGLRMCREHGMQSLREKAVWDVADLRQEMASSIIVNLWIIGQSMLTRARLPQFLPSTRRTLDELTAALALKQGEVFYDRDQDAVPVPLVYRRVFDAPILDYRSIRNVAESHTPSRRYRPTVHISRDPPMSPAALRKPALSGPNTDGILYLLAEHTLLLQVVGSLEALLRLTRYLLGELRFVHAEPSL